MKIKKDMSQKKPVYFCISSSAASCPAGIKKDSGSHTNTNSTFPEVCDICHISLGFLFW